MAEVKSGSFYTSGYSDPRSADCFLFSWSLVRQSIEENYSEINWSLVGAGGTSTYWTYVKEKYVTVNGETKSNATLQQIANDTVAFSGTSKIYHNSDGKKTFSASAGGAFYYYGSYNSTGSGTWELPQIPRQAKLTSAPNFTDEQNPTINYSNPAGNAVTSLQACISWTGGADILYRDIPKTGTSYTFNFTDAEREFLRKSCTTAKSRSVIFYVKTVIGGTTFYSTIEKTLTITNANPTVGSLTYKDNNAQTVFITEDNQRIIRENSQLLFTVGTATPKKSATISKYEITFNDRTLSRTTAGDLDFGIINLSSNSKAVLKVTDSRGNTATKEIEVIIDDWVIPKGTITLNRKNNYYSETYLKVDGSYSSLNGKNTMAIQYQYRKLTDKDFSELYDLEDNVQATIDLDNNYKWHIIVIVGDRLGETTYNLYLDRGMPIIYFDRLNENVGINCFPDGNYKLDIDGNTRGKNLPIATGINSLSDFDKVGVGEYLSKSGLYSVNVDNVWYHLLNIRHRNGESDGANYGLQIRSRFTMGSPIEYRQQNAGTWSEWKILGGQEKAFISEKYTLNKAITPSSWQTINGSNLSTNLSEGKYLITMSVAIDGAGAGIATIRPLINGTELDVTNRSSIPIASGLRTTTQVHFNYKVNTSGTFTFNSDVYSSVNCTAVQLRIEILQVE